MNEDDPEPGTSSSKASAFEAAFENLKSSDFYEAPPDQPPRKDTASSASAAAPTDLSIKVNRRQRGNPVLKNIRNVPWEFGDIVPDYVMGNTVCALFLSLRYHLLNPEYIHLRLKELGAQYRLRVLLVQVDVKDPHHSLKGLTKICVLSSLTLLLAWSPEEAGRILEVYKMFENKPPDLIKERQDEGKPLSKLVDALTTVRSVNKSDAMSLLNNFKSLEAIATASPEDMSLIPGVGPLKARKLAAMFNEPFLKVPK